MTSPPMAEWLSTNEQAPTSDPFQHENAFYLSCQPMRVGKLLAQYELFKRTMNLPGAIVECGVFKGASFARLAMFRQLLGQAFAKPLIGFDSFGTFIDADSPRDAGLRANVVAGAGEKCIGAHELRGVLDRKGCGENVRLIAGDICETLPDFVSKEPELKVSLLNLDLDFYRGTAVALKELWPRLVVGGVMMLDDYGVFEGETQAVDAFFGERVRVHRLPFCYSPSYIVKGGE